MARYGQEESGRRKARPVRSTVRALVTLLLLLTGLAMVVCGAGFHSLAVLMEQKVDIPGFAVRPGLPSPFPGAPPPGLPQFVEIITLEESEPRLILEVSRGGVARLPSGEIKRTYSGAAPSLCPT